MCNLVLLAVGVVGLVGGPVGIGSLQPAAAVVAMVAGALAAAVVAMADDIAALFRPI